MLDMALTFFSPAVEPATGLPVYDKAVIASNCENCPAIGVPDDCNRAHGASVLRKTIATLVIGSWADVRRQLRNSLSPSLLLHDFLG